MSICVNCTSNTSEDIEIVGQIVKIRLKTKDLSGVYLECIKYEIFLKYLRFSFKGLMVSELNILENLYKLIVKISPLY